MEINASDNRDRAASTKFAKCQLIRTVVTVAWMSVLLGVGLELLLIALAAGAGTASKLQPLHRRFKPENILGLICLPAVAKVIAPAPVIVAPVAAPPVALARPKVTPALPPKAKNPTAGRTADARAQPDSHAHPYAGTGEIVA